MHTILMLIKFHSYKIILVQELNDDNPNRRLEFCDLMMGEELTIPTSYLTFIFFDEATYEWNDQVNKYNFKYWNDNNPHWMLENYT